MTGKDWFLILVTLFPFVFRQGWVRGLSAFFLVLNTILYLLDDGPTIRHLAYSGYEAGRTKDYVDGVIAMAQVNDSVQTYGILGAIALFLIAAFGGTKGRDQQDDLTQPRGAALSSAPPDNASE